MEAVGRLAGGIAHDFNNLLTVIQGQADFLLLDGTLDDEHAEEVRVMREAALRAAQLTGQLLAFGREQVLRPEVLDLNQVIREMLQIWDRILGEDVEIQTRLDEDLPPVRLDPGQLEQVMMNLAVNARQAMPGGGRLRVETRGAVAEGDRDGEPVVLVRVSDSGVGMDETTRSQIFDPFFTTKGEEGGTGLGLSVTYGIVKQSGGSIEVESEPGEGSTFSLCFPAVSDTLAPRARAEPPEDGSYGLSGTTLIVEDDPSVLKVTRRILERAGLEVVSASDAESARAVLESRPGEIDLLLTDLVLPGVGGGALVEEVRRDLPDLRVVVMSGYAPSSANGQKDLPAEVGFIQKPFAPRDLMRVVRQALNS